MSDDHGRGISSFLPMLMVRMTVPGERERYCTARKMWKEARC